VRSTIVAAGVSALRAAELFPAGVRSKVIGTAFTDLLCTNEAIGYRDGALWVTVSVRNCGEDDLVLLRGDAC
jgi:hypothetical protein